MDFGWTPHSPRAGFASEAIQDGVPFQEIKEAGRWLVDSSLRAYIDLVQTAQIAVDVQARGLLPAVEFVAREFFRFFPELSTDCRELSHGSKHDARAGRSALPQVESRAWPEAGRLPDADETSEGEEQPKDRHSTSAVRFSSSREDRPAGRGKGASKGRGQAKGGGKTR